MFITICTCSDHPFGFDTQDDHSPVGRDFRVSLGEAGSANAPQLNPASGCIPLIAPSSLLCQVDLDDPSTVSLHAECRPWERNRLSVPCDRHLSSPPAQKGRPLRVSANFPIRPQTQIRSDLRTGSMIRSRRSPLWSADCGEGQSDHGSGLLRFGKVGKVGKVRKSGWISNIQRNMDRNPVPSGVRRNKAFNHMSLDE
jgi:hypothetical protein